MDDSPSVDEANRVLAQVESTVGRSRRLVADSNLARPLIAWGVAWVVGAVAVTASPEPVGWLVAAVASGAAGVASWAVRDRTVRTGRERRILAAWVCVAVACPLFVTLAQPPSVQVAVLIACAVWALALLLFGVAGGHRIVGGAGAIMLALTVVGSGVGGPSGLLVGWAGGGLVMVVGGLVCRWRRP